MTSRRARLELGRRRILLGLLVSGVAAFGLGLTVGLAVGLVALSAAMLVGFELSRPVAAKDWLERSWASIVYGLCLAPLACLAGIVYFSFGPLEITMPSGRREPMDVLLIMVGGWLGAAGAATAAVHIVRRRGPPVVFRLLRHLWWLLIAATLVFFALPIVLPGLAAIGGAIAAGVMLGAIVWTVWPVRRETAAPPQPEVPMAVPTFRAFKGP